MKVSPELPLRKYVLSFIPSDCIIGLVIAESPEQAKRKAVKPYRDRPSDIGVLEVPLDTFYQDIMRI